MANHKSLEEFQKLDRKQTQYTNACAVLGEILREHPELTLCIQSISSHIIDKMETNDKQLCKLYGKHGEELIVSKVQ